MKRFALFIFLCCLAGCSVLGLGGEDDRCGEREGLFIQTDRDAYQVGEDITLTVENCIGKATYIDKDYGQPPEYELEKKVVGEWVLAGTDGGGGLYTRRVETKNHNSRKFTFSVEPYEDYVDTIPGTYRYELDIFYDSQNVKSKLPNEERRSNTFEIFE